MLRTDVSLQQINIASQRPSWDLGFGESSTPIRVRGRQVRKCGSQCEDRDACRGEDPVREVGNVSEDGGAQQNTADDFGDDPWLTDARKDDGEELSEDEDDAHLNDPERKGVRGIVLCWIISRDDAALAWL